MTSLPPPPPTTKHVKGCWRSSSHPADAPTSLQTQLLPQLPVPASQVLTIDPQLPVEAAAEDYAQKLRQVSLMGGASGCGDPRGTPQ